ncbi:MAG: hypothetical protein A2X28_10715 [Elusimicrobia bacterium GWA2_56_46]|nr:MAG: hypothetical protein A2X28_10715 [Elusimicrobia bacterium GWA2_56_46]OGR55112.1 MAG: hypothetical protein A2X39_09625 [Elusimicrobia bacterium GWC2_56_31]HBB67319.1 hypothetical protein [Elusimicrobiota bacterium]HBW23835.1 hypothetical protein [Elusimicrobiota bacterium]
MRTELFLALLLLPLRPLVAAGAGEGVPWGSETDGQYRAWDWISAFTEEDRNTWDGLDADGQEALLKRAGDACLAADRASLAAQTRGEAGVLSALPDETLDQLSICVENGKTRAGALREKRDRLNQIILRSKNRQLSRADLTWLEANSIRLKDPSFNDAAAAGEIERQNKTAQKRSRNAEKKYSRLKEGKPLTSAGLASIYDGSGSKGKDSPQYPETIALKDRTNAKLSIPGPETRGPRKKLTSSAPPELALAPDKIRNGSPKAGEETRVERKIASPFPEEDVAQLDKVVQKLKSNWLEKGHTSGRWGNLKQTLHMAKKQADGTGSGCRDWSEEVSMAINRDPQAGKKYEAGVLCGAKVPYLAQHCVTVFYPKGSDPNDPSTQVWHYDAWASKTKSGPVEEQLCSNPIPIEQDFTSKWPFGQVPTGTHHISFYGIKKTGDPEIIRELGGYQTNMVFNRECPSGR